MSTGTIVVEIPLFAEHGGYPGCLRKIEISDKCPVCGAKRAVKSWKGLSYDGSRRLPADCWQNECDHVDTYSSVVKEGKIVSFETPSITEMVK